MDLQLRISGPDYELLRQHLLPPDGKEAVAVALCGRFETSSLTILLVHEVTLIPYDECYSREPDYLQWPTERIRPYFEHINKRDFALLKIHSHPNGYNQFSRTDDESDVEFFESAFGWAINDKPHASAVMLPNGEIFGRFVFNTLTFKAIGKISIAADVIMSYAKRNDKYVDEFSLRTIQAFGEATYQRLKHLCVGVVGCSGTGSPTIEQLVRLGVGKVILIDPDTVELKNLNRILNSTRADALAGIPKVEVLAKKIHEFDLGTAVETFQTNLYDDVAVLKSLIKCDIIFGCMDSVDGRYLLNQLCTFYLIPYFDLGVKLEANGSGGITKICGTVHYLQPGKSSLLTRGVFTMDDLKAASQMRKNPEEYENLRKNSYIKNVNVNSPAVISVNMQIASHALNEFLNRIHAFKSEPPAYYAASTIDITESYIVNSHESDFEVDSYLKKKCGRGDIVPFIEIPELSYEIH